MKDPEDKFITLIKILYAFTISVVVCLLIGCLFGCSRKVTEKLSTEKKIYNANSLNVDSLSVVRRDTSYSFNTSSTDAWWNCEFTITEYSDPDSLGNQHPIKTTTGSAKGGSVKNDTTQSGIITNEETTNTIITDDSESYINEETNYIKKTKTSYFPMWVYVSTFFLFAIIILFIVVWIKKKGFY